MSPARKQERRSLIHGAWEQHYSALVLGEISMAEILGYDEAKLMALAKRGLGLYQAGKIEAARKVFKGLVILDPWVPYFHYLLGTAHEKLGRAAEAEAEMGRAVELAESLSPPPEVLSFALLGRGRVLGRRGAVREALSSLARIEKEGLSQDALVLNTARFISEHLGHGQAMDRFERGL